MDGEARRPGKIAFIDGRTQEASCFIEGPGVAEEMRRILPCPEGIAVVPASVVRECGFAIERRPDGCPEGFRCDPASHVVIGPPEVIRRKLYEKMARQIATHPETRIIPPE